MYTTTYRHFRPIVIIVLLKQIIMPHLSTTHALKINDKNVLKRTPNNSVTYLNPAISVNSSRSTYILSYTKSTPPTKTQLFLSRQGKGMNSDGLTRDKIRSDLVSIKHNSQTMQNWVSINDQFSNLGKLDSRLDKGKFSGNLLKLTGSKDHIAKQIKYIPNSRERQQVLNHDKSETKQNGVLQYVQSKCHPGKGQDCVNSYENKAENKLPSFVRDDIYIFPSYGQGSYVSKSVRKRDAEDFTPHLNTTIVNKKAPTPVEIHNKLLTLYRTTLNYTVDMTSPNDTMDAREQCLGLLTGLVEGLPDDGNTYCDTSWDNFSCWPRTLAGTNASIPCPSYLKGINDYNNASKYCQENGTWADKAMYDLCIIGEPEPPLPLDMEVDHLVAIRIIYNAGFTISTLALSIALFIFLYFRSLRCLRNAIHCHLIMTFILKNIIWIIMRHSLSTLQSNQYSGVCKMLTSVFNFTHATNFFWMFVEGLYLHIIIVWTYSADKIKLRYLVVIGWFLPAIDIVIWIAFRAEFANDHCWLPQTEGVSIYDYIFIVPILVVLLANIIFLSTIVWVLITKLRASHTLETRQYRKAVKATIILFPLLGITYVLFIMPPSDHPTVKIVFKYINAIMQSFQGLLVAVFYCFLNGEVKSVLKKKLVRFNDARSLSTKYTKTSVGWTMGESRAYGNSVSLANGNLVEDTKKTNDKTEHIPMTDTHETDKMLD